MRSNWEGNTTLRKHLQRCDPTAGAIAEVVVSTNRDIKDTRDDWSDADGLTGFLALDTGGVKLDPTEGAEAENTNANDSSKDITDMPNLFGDTLGVAAIEWSGADIEQYELYTLSATLDPDYDDTGAEVEEWVAQLFRVTRVEASEGDGPILTLQSLTPPVYVDAGDSPGEVDFVFGADGYAPRIGDVPNREAEEGPKAPTTVAAIWAIKGEGEQADNVAWQCSADTTVTSNGHTIRRYDLSTLSTRAEQGGKWAAEDADGVPIFSLSSQTYTEATISFTSGNLVDLGAAPSGDVEFVVEHRLPGGSSVTVELSDDSGSTWYEVADGDKAATDNSPIGGNDLTGLAAQQTYQARATLTPSTNAQVTPVLLRVGAEEIESTVLKGVAVVQKYGQRVDAITGQAEIPEAVIDVIQTGEVDYRDFVTKLLSDNYTGQLEFRLWVGDWNHAGQRWMLIDRYSVDDFEPVGSAVRFFLLSPLEYLRSVIPAYDSTTQKREVLTYANSSIKDTWSDLVTGQLGVPGRYVGPGPEDDSTTISKRIEESDGKQELDAVSILAGGTNISSQGRVKFAKLHHDRPPLQILPYEAVSVESAPAGLRNRITEYFVPYNWDRQANNGQGKYQGELRYYHAEAITNFGQARIDPPLRLDDRVARWIDTEDLAGEYLNRLVTRVAAGLKIWRIRSTLPMPQLEIGDPIAFETNRLIMLDPNTLKSAKGMLWVIADVVGEHDVLGNVFDVWIRAWGEVRPTSSTVTRLYWSSPRISSASVTWAYDSGSGEFTPTVQFQTEDAGSVKAIGDDTSHQGKSTVRAQSANATDSEGYVSVTLATTYEPGETMNLSALAFEEDDATGSEAATLFKDVFHCPLYWAEDARPILDEDNGVLDLLPNRPGWAAAVYYRVYEAGDGSPTKANVTGLGAKTTDDPITSIHTFTTDEERVEVGVVAVENADGTGKTGSLQARTWVYRDQNDRPDVVWFPYVTTSQGKEGVRLVARDDSAQVRLYHRVYTSGDSPPSYTDSGLQSDPYVLSIEVTRPSPGDENKIVEFYAEDADGNKSTDDPRRIYVDSNTLPSGSVTTDCNRSTGEPYAYVSTADADTLSWRMAVAKNGSASVAYNDALANEFSGNSFNGESPDLSSYKLTKGDYLNGEVVFFNTSSTGDSDQQAADASEAIGFTIQMQEETENKIRNLSIRCIPTDAGEYEFDLEGWAAAGTASINLSFLYTFSPAGGSAEENTTWDYNEDVSGHFALTLEGSGGSTLELGSNPYSSFVVAVTPYTEADGDDGSGTAGESIDIGPEAAMGWLGSGTKVTDGTNTYFADAMIAGKGTALASSGGRPQITTKPDDFIHSQSSAPSDPDEGELWCDTTSSPATLKRYNGSSWDSLGTFAS
mgnify:CR=1 FL=1